MFCVGLTGGIGSGKSTVAKLFQRLGATIIDADEIAHEITKPNTYSYEAIIEHFGKEIARSNGELDRAALRRIIFNNPIEREWLENRLHPVIREAMKERAIKADTVYSILVIPLLTETKLKNYNYIDRVCVIEVPETIQIQRVMERDHVSKEEVLAILNIQSSNKVRLKFADDIIHNNSDLDYLKNSVFELNQKYLKFAEIKRKAE